MTSIKGRPFWELDDTVRQTLPDGTTKDWKITKAEGPTLGGAVFGGTEAEFRENRYTLSCPDEENIVIAGTAFFPSKDGPAMFENIDMANRQAAGGPNRA